MRESIAIALIVLSVIIGMGLVSTFHRNEDRKAYYACLQLSEKLAEQQKQSDGGVRIVSLPYCRP
jgi:uncharacterized protein YxeA